MKPDTAAEWFERIRAMFELYDSGSDDGPRQDAAMQELGRMVQSVQVRAGWYSINSGCVPPTGSRPAEYRINLSPHVRIVGELSDRGQPVTARLEQFRDDPSNSLESLWCDASYSIRLAAALEASAYDAILLRFAAHFWFGG